MIVSGGGPRGACTHSTPASNQIQVDYAVDILMYFATERRRFYFIKICRYKFVRNWRKNVAISNENLI